MRDLAQVNPKLVLRKRVTDILAHMKQTIMSDLRMEAHLDLHQRTLFSQRHQPHKQHAGQGSLKQHTELK